jgi:hypothetical protein
MLYDRKHQSQNENGSATRRILRTLFKDQILSDKKLMDATTACIRSALADLRRRSERVAIDPVSQLLDLYYSYRDEAPKHDAFDHFFELFDEETADFYNAFFDAHFASVPFPEYLKISSEQFTHEEKILGRVLHEVEKNKILGVVNDCLLVNVQSNFLSGDEPSICAALSFNDRRPVKWLVDTYRRFETSLDDVYSSAAKYIKQKILNQSSSFKPDMNSNDTARLVGDLIALADSLSDPYVQVFQDVPKAIEALNKAINEAWNAKEFNIVENFCTYIDHYIRSEFKTFSEDQRKEFPSLVARYFGRLEAKLDFQKL